MSVRLDHGQDELEDIHEINVTPFIDVILVLLIIFMIAAPLATVDVNVEPARIDRRPTKAARQADLPDHQGRSFPGARRQPGLARCSGVGTQSETNGDKNQNHLSARRQVSAVWRLCRDYQPTASSRLPEGGAGWTRGGQETMSTGLTIPSDRTQTILRWGICFAVVLLAHALAVARLLEHSDFADEPPGVEVVELDLAPGDPQDQIDPIQYAPPKPIQQDVKPQEEPEQKEAEVALPKEVTQPEPPTPIEPAPPQEEQEAKTPPKVSPEAVHKWQITVNTRLNQFKHYPATGAPTPSGGKGRRRIHPRHRRPRCQFENFKKLGLRHPRPRNIGSDFPCPTLSGSAKRRRRAGSVSPGSDRVWAAITDRNTAIRTEPSGDECNVRFGPPMSALGPKGERLALSICCPLMAR